MEEWWRQSKSRDRGECGSERDAGGGRQGEQARSRVQQARRVAAQRSRGLANAHLLHLAHDAMAVTGNMMAQDLAAGMPTVLVPIWITNFETMAKRYSSFFNL